MPDAPLDPTEALKHIRTLVDAARDQAHDTPLAATFREITNVLDRALPKSKRATRKPKDSTDA